MIELKSTSAELKKWRLKLDENENPYGASLMALAAVKNLTIDDISNNFNSQKLLEKIALEYSLKVKNLCVSNSKDEILRLIFDTYLKKDDTVALYTPLTSGVFLNLKIKGILEYIKRDFNICLCDFSKAKIVYVSSPDEIFGTVTKTNEIRTAAKNFPNTFFVIDCSFINYSLNAEFADYVDLAEECENVILIKSYANDFGLAGEKIVCAFSNEKNISKINFFNFGNNINAASAVALSAALNDKKYYENIKELNQKAKEELFIGLKKLDYKPIESEANFILCDFGEYRDFYFQKLKNNGVLTKIFNDEEYSNYIRFTVPKSGGVKYLLELLKEKDVLIFNMDESLKDLKNISLIKDALEFASKKIDFVFYSCSMSEKEGITLLDELGIKDYFCSFNFSNNKEYKKLLEIKKYSKYKNIAILSDNIEGSILANMSDIEILGVAGQGSDFNYMYNNFRHFGAKHILGNFADIKEFIDNAFNA